MLLKILPHFFLNPTILPEQSETNWVMHTAHVLQLFLPSRLLITFSKQWAVLTIALSWELLAWVIPRMLVVCITSTEKLGSQLAIRDPKTNKKPAQVLETSFPCQLLCGRPLYGTSRYSLRAYFTPGLLTNCPIWISSFNPH